MQIYTQNNLKSSIILNINKYILIYIYMLCQQEKMIYCALYDCALNYLNVWSRMKLFY